jgi:hypothetical protein
MPLTYGGQMHGLLAFYFNEERDFDAEALEIGRALATQAGLAIHLTRLAERLNNQRSWRKGIGWPVRFTIRWLKFLRGFPCSYLRPWRL